MSIKPIIDQLVAQDGRNMNQLAIAYGQLRDGEEFAGKRQDTYRTAVLKTLTKPDAASAEVLFRVLAVLGVDAEAAIAAAASQVKPK